MKKYYLLLVVLMGLSVYAQNPNDIVNIPDGIFKAKLLQASPTSGIAQGAAGNIKIDINNDSEIQVSEALNVHKLNVSGWQISSLIGIEAFLNLKQLRCWTNFLSSLNLSQNINLEFLHCYNNDLTTLILPQTNTLTDINCYGNELTSIDISPYIGLTKLNISSNQLSSLDVSQNTALVNLYCQGNELTNLDLTQNVNLFFLDCASNQLTNLNVSQNINLKNLSCDGNELTSLNVTQNTSLTLLDCSFNSLTNLDVTQNILLNHLRCNNNQLSGLDLSQNNVLASLTCNNNQLSSLDLTQTLVLSFFCQNNQLSSLFIKNGIQNTFAVDFSGNSNLQYICADEEEFIYIQSMLNNYGYTTELNTYCTFTPGGVFYTINGTSILDSNTNGCDDTDIIFPNLKFNATNGTQSGNFISNQSGQYSIPVSTGTHTIMPVIENPTYFNISPATASVTFPETTSPFTQNFCVTPNGLHPDLEVAIIPTTPARPGFDAFYKLLIKNKGNIQQSGSVTFTYNDAVLDYLSANPLATTQATGTMTWDFANLQPFETREIALTLNLNSPMETPAVNGGDVLNYTAVIASSATDDMPLDNTFSLPQIVVNSFDPNDKTCLEGTSITPDMIGKYVHYMIRFENTGTFPAENIVVKDMIDATKFDVASLIPLNASHDYTTRITGNKVEFIFENINLPFEDATNDGYIVFKIKTLPTLALGDSFSNSASIYFDYNFPIVTDPAVTTFATLATQDFVFNNYLTVYPNPTNDVLNLTAKQAIELKSMSVYNVVGQLVLSVPNAKGVSTIDVSNLTVGTYFLKVVSDKGTSNVKFMKK